jgi:hypothetical protein
MLNYFESMKMIQDKIGEIRAADGIEELSWLTIVISRLNEMSRTFSRELEVEPGAPLYYKPFLIQADDLISPKIERYGSMPPMRLLSLAVLLCSWLGWVLTKKNLDVYGELKINEAFEFGRIRSTTDIVL